MKKYEAPEVMIQEFEIADVVTVSGEIENGPNMTDKG